MEVPHTLGLETMATHCLRAREADALCGIKEKNQAENFFET